MATRTRSIETQRIRDANVCYHDQAADTYDSKWAIDYGAIGAGQVLGKLRKALGEPPGHYARALEVGAGTGYFTLNLLRSGVIDRAVATDISPGMLRRLSETAGQLGLAVDAVEADAAALPFPDASFELVMGHAVLHHLPDLDSAMSEFHRVLAPGGTMVFMGEPSHHGDRLAIVPKWVGGLVEPAWRRAVSAAPRANGAHPGPHAELTYGELEGLVDVHTFGADELRALSAAAGFAHVRVCGEELLANMYGWFLRRLESDVDPVSVPRAWHKFAFRSYLALQSLDGRLLEPRLPANLFYNLMVSARKPR